MREMRKNMKSRQLWMMEKKVKKLNNLKDMKKNIKSGYSLKM